MARPKIRIDRGLATLAWVNQIWNRTLPPRRTRLAAIDLLLRNENASRESIAEGLGISTRQLLRWIHLFNENGLQGFLYPERRRPGRKRTVTNEVSSKIHRIITIKLGVERSDWTVAEIHRKLASDYGCKIGYRSLLRFFHRRGTPPSRRKPQCCRNDERVWLQNLGIP